MTLEQRVAKLEAELKSQKDTRSIPRDLENALRDRLKVLTASSTNTGSFSAISRTINLSGNAQNISVLEDPAGYIPVLFRGQTYKVPYWVD